VSTSNPCTDCTQDPQVVGNPPNQSTVTYRVDDFTGFRRALLQPRADESALSGWRPAPGDLGLQVLEWWAYLADILTFYNERIANESYLGTAELPASVSGLVALLGYQPRPGIAATGLLAASRRAGRPQEPLAIPEGTQFSSQATPSVPSQTFEATASSSYTGESNAVAIPPPDTDLLTTDAATGDQSVLLEGTVTGIKPGDSLLLMERGWAGADDNWAWVTVAAVAPAPNPYGRANTRVALNSVNWGPVLTPFERGVFEYSGIEQVGIESVLDTQSELGDVAKLGDIAESSLPTMELRESRVLSGSAISAVFSGAKLATSLVEAKPVITDLSGRGRPVIQHPSKPPSIDLSHQASGYRLLKPRQAAAIWSQTSDGAVVGSYPSMSVRLSAVIRSIAPRDVVLFDAGSGGIALAQVATATDELLTEQYPDSTSVKPSPPDIVLPHTLLGVTLASESDGRAVGGLPPTSTAVRHAFRDVGTLIPTPATSLTSLPVVVTVPTPADFAVPAIGCNAFLADGTGTGIPVFAKPAGGNSVQLTAVTTTPESFSLQAPIQLLIDLLEISQGTTVPAEALGTGNATIANQTFKLKNSPLTYLAAADGYASPLQVAVDGVYWTEVDSVYGQAADATIFTVSQQSDGSSVVRFGDGLDGARLPTGCQVVATYRYGSGATSPPAGRLTTILKPQPNLASVQNPVGVAGGDDPEQPGSIRTNAPKSVLTFGRAISADDYQAVAAQAPGVTRASAFWTWDAASQRTLVKVYVGDDPAAAGLAAAALSGSEDPNRPVAVVQATPITLDVACTLVVSPRYVTADVGAAAQGTLTELFSPGNMPIGATLYSSQIEAALQVPGAVAVHGLSVLAGTAPAFSGPVAATIPGEGAYFTLGSISITAVSGDG
jgi:uncharacterized phage protein gp47/JayE